MADDIGVPIVAVDYSSIAGLIEVIESHKVDTVISALFTMPVLGTPEVNLIKATQLSRTAKRFVPSYWAIPLDER